MSHIKLLHHILLKKWFRVTFGSFIFIWQKNQIYSIIKVTEREANCFEYISFHTNVSKFMKIKYYKM